MSKTLQIGKLYRISERFSRLRVHSWTDDLSLNDCPPLTCGIPFLVLSLKEAYYGDTFFEIKALVGDTVRYFKLRPSEVAEITDEQ